VTLLDLLGALVLLGSVLLVIVALARLAYLAVLGRRRDAGRTARFLGLYVAAYAVVLGVVGLAMPRESRAPGERACFDDWCVAGLRADAAGSGSAPCAAGADTRVWIVSFEVSSDARRVRQRARDARALLEDARGREYEACAGPLGAHALTDVLDPGESFVVQLPFRLPGAAAPAGAVISHGAFPGVLLIGDDQSLLHRRRLLGLTVGGR